MTGQKNTSKTNEGRSATFRIQGFGFVFLVFFVFLSDAQNMIFLASIAARFPVTFLKKLSRHGELPLGGLFFLLSLILLFCSVFCFFSNHFLIFDCLSFFDFFDLIASPSYFLLIFLLLFLLFFLGEGGGKEEGRAA